MTRFVAGTSLILWSAFGAFAQSPTRPEFEVASIKPAKQSNDGRMMVMMGGDPGRVNYVNVTLKDLIRRAYGVKDYQIEGPDWMNQMRFDVTATHSPNTPKETVSLMMQALLQDRFKMTVHMEKKQMQAYAMIEAKGGFKLKQVADEPAPGSAPGGPGGPNAGVGGGFAGGGRGGDGGGGGRGAGGGGGPAFADVMRGGPGGGPPRGMIRLGPRGHMEAAGITINALADILVNQVGRPVVNTTEIKGLYDITLDYTPDDSVAQRGFLGGPPPPGAAAEHKAEAEKAASEGRAEAPSIFVALQEKLGLKLEARKEPVEIVVIDKAEKVPTEN